MLWLFALLITLWVLFYYKTPLLWATAVLGLLLGAYTVTYGLTQCSIKFMDWVFITLYSTQYPLHPATAHSAAGFSN